MNREVWLVSTKTIISNIQWDIQCRAITRTIMLVILFIIFVYPTFSGVSSWIFSAISTDSNFLCQNGKHAVSFSASLVFGWCWPECIKPQLVFNESRARYLTSNRLTDMLVTLMPICRDVQLGLFLLLLIKVSLQNSFPPQEAWGREEKITLYKVIQLHGIETFGQKENWDPIWNSILPLHKVSHWN